MFCEHRAGVICIYTVMFCEHRAGVICIYTVMFYEHRAGVICIYTVMFCEHRAGVICIYTVMFGLLRPLNIKTGLLLRPSKILLTVTCVVLLAKASLYMLK